MGLQQRPLLHDKGGEGDEIDKCGTPSLRHAAMGCGKAVGSAFITLKEQWPKKRGLKTQYGLAHVNREMKNPTGRLGMQSTTAGS